MNTHTGKLQENASRAVANNLHKQSKQNESVFQLEEIKQNELAEMANKSPQVMQLRAYQEMADNNQRAKQADALLTMADSRPRPQSPPVQRKENDTGLPD